MGTISKMVQHRMESFQQKQMKLDDLTQPEWHDIADFFCQSVIEYGTTEFKVPAVVKRQTDTTAATPSPTTFGELIQTLVNVPGQSQMTQLMSRPGTSQMCLCSEKPQAHSHISPLMPDAVPNSSQMEISKPVEHISVYPCIWCP